MLHDTLGPGQSGKALSMCSPTRIHSTGDKVFRRDQAGDQTRRLTVFLLLSFAVVEERAERKNHES